MLVSTVIRAVTAQTLAISSTTSAASGKSQPWPPSARGMVMPRKPASLSTATLSQGYCSVRSTSAARPRNTPSASFLTSLCSSRRDSLSSNIGPLITFS